MDDKTKDMYKYLAADLCAAYIAYRLGVTQQTARKHYVDIDKMGITWYNLAESIDKLMLGTVEGLLDGGIK